MQSPIRVPVMFAAFYGMRRSEALGIRKAVIDRKKKTITACHTIIEVNLMGEHKIIRKDRTKNKKSFRTYPLIPQIEMFLDWELQQQEKQRELMGSCYYMGDQEYICCLLRSIVPAGAKNAGADAGHSDSFPLPR